MHPTKTIGALAAGLALSAGVYADDVESNLGVAAVQTAQSSIFGETEEEIRRNRALTIAGVAGAIVLGAVLLDDDGSDDEEEPPVTPHVPIPGHHASSHGG